MTNQPSAADPALAAPRAVLQEAMAFLGALTSGIEDAVGPTANSITYTAGKNLGKRLSAGAPKTDDLEQALGLVRSVLQQHHCLWGFEAFKPKAQADLVQHDEGGDAVMLVFRDCMIRQSLFYFGHEQKGSLCNMMFGFFAGALETIMGCQSNLEIIHAGENACYKRLTVVRQPRAE
jgi:predicted hydrocarbon binding protein